MTQAAAGLAHMHDRGWIHRDIKPDNILLNSSGEIKLIDFALAKRIERSAGMFGWLRGGPQERYNRWNPQLHVTRTDSEQTAR